MKDVRENEQLNTEIQRHDEIFQALADLTAAVRNLEAHSMERDKRVDEMYDYFTKGSAVVWFIKWIFGTAVAIGGMVLMVKAILHGSN